MPLADLSTFADSILGQSVYFGPLLLLVLCGFGLPLPEEFALIGAGILLWNGEADFRWMLPICMAGVVFGDAVPYTVGRLWGASALRYRVVRRLLHPRRHRRLERRFQEHRNWAVFTCRFLPGLRWPGYFVAGTMRMSVPRWLTLDLTGAAIQVPLALWLGLRFGENVERLESELDQLHLVLGLALVGALVATFAWRRWRRRRRSLRPHRAPGAEPSARTSPDPVQVSAPREAEGRRRRAVSSGRD